LKSKPFILDVVSEPFKGNIGLLNPTYLLRSRAGIIYLRWPLPRQLHPQNRASEIKVSLQTRNPRKALRLSRLMIHIGELYNNLGIACRMDYQALRTTLQDHFRKLREQAKVKIDATGGLNALDKSVYLSSLAIAEHANETDTPLSFTRSDDDLVARFIDHYSLDVAKETDLYEQLERDIKRGYRRYVKDVLAYEASVTEYDLDPIPNVLPHSQAVSVPARMSLVEVINGYIDEKRDGKNWANKTESEKLGHFELLKEILGAERDVRLLSPMDAKKVKDTLRVYPVNREKNEATRGSRPLSEILDLPGVPKLHTTSVNKYLQSYGDLFNWARQNGHVDQNLFAGLSIRQNKARNQDSRMSFTSEQIQSILDAILSNKDGLAKKDYQKWGPLIGIYTGARLNEIAQLHLKDVREEEGVWCFDFNDEGDRKSLKTEASRRIIPVHPQLIELGLMNHLEEMKRRGETKLFPSFTFDPKNGWGRHLSRHFNNTLLPKLGIKNPQLVFHSLRHTVVTMLMQAGIDEPIVQTLVGHTRRGVTQQNYFKRGYTIQQLYGAIQKLDYCLPLRELQVPFGIDTDS